jgi:hypothetical protein
MENTTTTIKYELLRDFYKNVYEAKKAEYLQDLENALKALETFIAENPDYDKRETKNKETENPKKAKKELKDLDKKYNNLLAELDKIESFNLEDFRDMSIHIDWKKSATWGANPRGKLTVFHNKGYSLEFYENTYKISGCGYCKESTSTADLLNQSIVIKKLILNKIEKLLCINRNANEIKDLVGKNGLELRESINYGISQYGLNLPRFDGGVGVSCHESILKKLGLGMRKISWSKDSDTWILEKI